MSQSDVNLPYFDVLLKNLEQGNSDVIQAFGSHVHWGYWDNPTNADGSIVDYAQASEKLSRKICNAAKIKDGMRILEVGCGFGGTIASLNDRFSNLYLVGLNIDERQLNRAKKQVKPSNNNQIEFVVANACQLPFEKDFFDAVIAIECIFHFPSRVHFFQEVQRVVVSHGKLALSDYLPRFWVSPLIKILNPISKPIIEKSFGYSDITYTLAEYRSLAKKTGLLSCIEEDITINTLPTYKVFKTLQRRRSLKNFEIISTLAENISYLRLLSYMILSFEKI